MSSLQPSTAPSPFLHHLPLRTRSVSVSWAVRLTGLSLSTSLFPFSEAQVVRLLLSCCPAPRSASLQALLQPCLLLLMGSPPSIPTILLSAPARDSHLLEQGLCHSGCAALGTDAQQNSSVRVKGSGGWAGWAWEPGSSPGFCHCPGNLRNVPAGCARGPEPHPSRLVLLVGCLRVLWSQNPEAPSSPQPCAAEVGMAERSFQARGHGSRSHSSAQTAPMPWLCLSQSVMDQRTGE